LSAFASARRRLQASLIETRRVEGKVRHEHVAALGAIDTEQSVSDRVTFWAQLHPRLDRLANRLDTETHGKVLAAVHARIPMPTIDDIRSVQLENAETDERVWGGLAEMQTERAEGSEKLAASAQHAAAESREQAKKASSKAAEAKDRVERLKRGEAVASRIGRPVDIEQIFREAGWTKADIEHARMTNTISRLGGFEQLLDETNKRYRSAEASATRAVLKRVVIQGLREGCIKLD
jgi:hypothetical protein